MNVNTPSKMAGTRLVKRGPVSTNTTININSHIDFIFHTQKIKYVREIKINVIYANKYFILCKVHLFVFYPKNFSCINEMKTNLYKNL